MTQRTFTGKTGDVWTWEETPETVAALKQLHKTVVENRVNRPHNYEGPLYAPHLTTKRCKLFTTWHLHQYSKTMENFSTWALLHHKQL